MLRVYKTKEEVIRVDKLIKSDVLVIGAGNAGFFAGIKAAEAGATVTIVDKGYAGKSGQSQNMETMIVFDPKKHDLKEWVESDRGCNEYVHDPKWVEITYKESMDRWNDLARWGYVSYRYDKDGNVVIMPLSEPDEAGEYTPGEEGLGGTGKGRVATPVRFRFICSRQQWRFRKVCKDLGINLMDRMTITDLIKQDGKIVGAVGFSADNEDTYVFQAKAVVMAAGNGGIKNAGFRCVTTTGDAQAMAFRAGCSLTGKEWADYHPARADFPAYAWSGGIDRDYFVPKQNNAKHHGLLVYNNEGDFIDNMREDPEARKRSTGQIFDAVAMAWEAHQGRAPTYFYVTWDPNTAQMNHSPKGMPRAQLDEDMMKEGKVRMASGRAIGQSHHLSDGIWPTDDYSCAIEGMPGLWACGDCLGGRPGYPMAGFAYAYTSVTGTRAGENAAAYAKTQPDFKLDQNEVKRLTDIMWAPKLRKGGFTADWALQVIHNTLIPYWVLILKSEEQMQNALNTIIYLRDNILPKLWAQDMHELRKCHEIKSILLHAEMKLRVSMFRTESRWNHYRLDYPLRDDKNWLCWIKIKPTADGGMEFVKVRVPEELRPDENDPYIYRYPYKFPNEPEVIPEDM